MQWSPSKSKQWEGYALNAGTRLKRSVNVNWTGNLLEQCPSASRSREPNRNWKHDYGEPHGRSRN